MNKTVKALIATNEEDHQIYKAVEELNELATALMQYQIKRAGKTTKQDVIDEIGDVKIRLEILIEVFGKEGVDKRYNEKLNKFQGYLDKGKYVGKI